MKLSHFVLVLILSALVAFAAGRYAAPTTPQIPASTYDRVTRSNTLRCGYSVYAPYFTRDAATGAFGGIWHDLTEAIGDHLGLQIIWAEEVGLGDIPAALNDGKIDLFCGGLWTAGKRVRAVDFLHPSAFEPLLVYVKADDHRFDAGLAAMNDPGVKIAVIDGEGGSLVAAEEFPKATLVSLTQLSTYADMFNQVATGKADAFFSAPSGVAAFIKNNPGILRPLATQPLRIFPVAFAARYGDDKLRDMLNQAQDDIIASGKLEKIISQYETNPGDFWRVAPPYVQPQP